MPANCILRPVESWNHSIRSSAQGIQKSSQGESQDHTRGDIEMEFNIRPSTTKILRQMETNGLVIDTLAPVSPPPPLLGRTVQRWGTINGSSTP